MYHRERRKMNILICILSLTYPVTSKNIATDSPHVSEPIFDTFDNNIIDFDEEYSTKFNKKYGVPWNTYDKFNRESHRYTIIKDDAIVKQKNYKTESNTAKNILEDATPTADYSVIPLELISTTENVLISLLESTTEPDLTVIPLSTTAKVLPEIVISQTVTIPPSTQSPETTTDIITTTQNYDPQNITINEDRITTTDNVVSTTKREVIATTESIKELFTTDSNENTTENIETTTPISDLIEDSNVTDVTKEKQSTTTEEATTVVIELNKTTLEDDPKLLEVNVNKTELEVLKTNSSKQVEKFDQFDASTTESIEFNGEVEELDVPEDYYDSKDVVPTNAPKTDALSVIFGFAGSVVESVVESVAERVVPKGIYDLFKRMQKQNEALEAERLRSREENGGIGQFGRGILKSLSSGLSKPLSQLMAGVRDIGSLDTDRGFVSSVASGVSSVANVANSVVDAFKDRVQAIYPGTVWCGDGHSATARSSDLGLFFFTDTCCREHDACKIYIKAGETKYGLTNTGLFTRSHCGCDQKFRECLRRTNSLVSAQIGLTYFNVLGPQCFRKAHPIVKCLRKTRITGLKCEEYELDYSKPKMWQWFDNETF